MQSKRGSNSAILLYHIQTIEGIGNNATVAKVKNLNYPIYYTICMKDLMVMVNHS
jgi:hypothetical protein